MNDKFIAAYDSMGDADAAMGRVWERLSAEAEELGVDLESSGARAGHFSQFRRTLPIAAVIATLLIAAVYAIGFVGIHKQLRAGQDKAAADPTSGFQAMAEPGDGDTAGLIIVGEDSALPAIERIAIMYTSPSGDLSAELGDNLKSPE